MRPGFPAGDNAEACLVVLGQAGQRGVDLGEVGGPAVAGSQLHARQQGPGVQLPVPHAGREQRLNAGRDM